MHIILEITRLNMNQRPIKDYIWSKNVLLTYIFDFVLKGRSDGETSNIVAAPETNYPVFNMNPNHEQVL